MPISSFINFKFYLLTVFEIISKFLIFYLIPRSLSNLMITSLLIDFVYNFLCIHVTLFVNLNKITKLKFRIE